MLDLIRLLKAMPNKTLWTVLLLAICNYLSYFEGLIPSGAMTVITTIALAIVMILKVFAPTGKLETGWKWTFYVSNGLLLMLSLLDLFATRGVLSGHAVTILTMIINGAIGFYTVVSANIKVFAQTEKHPY